MTVGRERWYVIGCPERNMYMHWKGDHVSGTYTDTGDTDDAERFDTRRDAVRAMRDEDVAHYLDNRRNLGIRVCRVERVTRAT